MASFSFQTDKTQGLSIPTGLFAKSIKHYQNILHQAEERHESLSWYVQKKINARYELFKYLPCQNQSKESALF